MNILLKRYSGYTKLDVVVRAWNPIDNVVDYAYLDQDGTINWVDGSKMGAGDTREAELILKDLKKIGT